MHRLILPAAILLAMALAQPAGAQTTVIQKENVRTEYARVLRVEPVYQTLRATSMIERCDQSTPVDNGTDTRSGLARVMGAVKDALTPGTTEDEEGAEGDPEVAADPAEDCRLVPMEREFRRPIAYDVDYVHHGVKYRSRLPYDPGNRLRVRVSITPVVPIDEEH